MLLGRVGPLGLVGSWNLTAFVIFLLPLDELGDVRGS